MDRLRAAHVLRAAAAAPVDVRARNARCNWLHKGTQAYPSVTKAGESSVDGSEELRYTLSISEGPGYGDPSHADWPLRLDICVAKGALERARERLLRQLTAANLVHLPARQQLESLDPRAIAVLNHSVFKSNPHQWPPWDGVYEMYLDDRRKQAMRDAGLGYLRVTDASTQGDPIQKAIRDASRRVQLLLSTVDGARERHDLKMAIEQLEEAIGDRDVNVSQRIGDQLQAAMQRTRQRLIDRKREETKQKQKLKVQRRKTAELQSHADKCQEAADGVRRLIDNAPKRWQEIRQLPATATDERTDRQKAKDTLWRHIDEAIQTARPFDELQPHVYRLEHMRKEWKEREWDPLLNREKEERWQERQRLAAPALEQLNDLAERWRRVLAVPHASDRRAQKKELCAQLDEAIKAAGEPQVRRPHRDEAGMGGRVADRRQRDAQRVDHHRRPRRYARRRDQHRHVRVCRLR